MLLLTTHGILHLLGYDHAEPEEKEEMFGLQRELLDGIHRQRSPVRDDPVTPLILVWHGAGVPQFRSPADRGRVRVQLPPAA